MGEPRRGAERSLPTWGEVGLGALAAVVVLSLGLVAAVQTQRLSVQRRAVVDQVAVGAAAAGVAVDLERGLDEVSRAAALAPTLGASIATGPRAQAQVPGAVRMGFVAAPPAPAAADAVLSAGARQDADVAALLDRTRDSGEADAAMAADVDGTTETLMVAAAYRAGAGPGPAFSPSDRRERLIGWVVAVIDLDQLARLHRAEPDVVRVVAGASPRPAGLAARFPSQREEVRGQAVTIVGGDPDPVGRSTAAIGVGLAAVIAASVVGAFVTGVARRARQADEERRRAVAQVELIGEVAPLVQQSLELAEVLPAVAVQLTDHFGLAGVGLSTGAGARGGAELFRIGMRADPPPKPLLRPPDQVGTGEAISLALQRGGRTVAVLEVVAGRALDASDLRSLQAISELVTAAVVNASLYASQQAAVRRLRDLDALKTVFLSTASHELRTPATAISGFASLLSTGWEQISEEQRQDFIARIAANARSLSAVVQDLLDFSLLDREAVPLSLAPVELDQIVKGVIDRLAPMFADHTITFTSTGPGPVLAELNGLERVVTNLLTNAVKFSPSGSTVLVAVGAADGGAEVVVSDEGPGVPLEERQRIFTRFYRGGGEVVVRTRGVGIGLSVVAELVERMKGRVAVDEAPGGGARFTVWLPRGTVTPEEEEVRADATTG